MRRSTTLLIFGCLTLVACGGNNSVKCSFKNPIVLDESPDQWPKFRRDSQNTGTISLANDAYEMVASGGDREAVWVFPRIDEPARGPFAASASLNSADGDDHRVYVGSTDGFVFALQAADGAPAISTSAGDGVLFSVAPVAVTSSAMVGTLDGLDAIVVGTGAALLVGIDGTGTVLQKVWPFPTDTFVRASPAMSINGLILTGSLGAGGFGVCPNGVGRFGVIFGSVETSPAVGRDPDKHLDGSFFIGANSRRLTSLTNEGVINWTFSMSAPIVSSPVVQLSSDGTETDAIYAADVSGLISKVDSTGQPIADFGFERGSIGRTESSPALTEHPTAGRRLYLGSDDGNLYAVDATTGTVIWSYATGGVIRSSPAVVLNADAPSDPIIVVGSFDGTLYYVRDSGSEPVLVGMFTVPPDISPRIPNSIESSPSVDRDGTVIFGADNGRLYAVR